MRSNKIQNVDCKLNFGYDGKLSVEGEVHFANVLDLVTKGNKFIIDNDNIVVELSKLIHSDSSALAMLLEWQRNAIKSNKTISFINCNRLLLDVSRVCGLDEVLYFK